LVLTLQETSRNPKKEGKRKAGQEWKARSCIDKQGGLEREKTRMQSCTMSMTKVLLKEGKRVSQEKGAADGKYVKKTLKFLGKALELT